MAQISGLQILSICFLLLGAGCEGGAASAISSAALSDSESYFDKCEYIECPEIPETETAAEAAAGAQITVCPADSSIEVKEFDGIQLSPLQFSHDTRAKRDLQSKCCNTPRCRCNQCPTKPHCKADEVLIELSPGNGQPGSCCTQYKCGKEPVCEGSGVNYWMDSCIKCNSCNSGPCKYVCTEPSPPSNCLTNVGEIKVNGMSWIEDKCFNCTCSEGKRWCKVSQCQKAECDNPITLPDVCCPVCPTNSTTATSTTSTTTTTTEAAMSPSSTTSVEITTTERVQTEAKQSSPTSTISSSTTTLEPLEETTNISIEVEIPVELPEESVEEVPVTVSNLEREITEELSSSSTSTTTKEEEEKAEENEEKAAEKEEKAEEKPEEKEESTEEPKEEEQTEDNLEDSTMDTPEIESSSSTFSTSSPASPVDSTFPTSTVTTEHPNAPATSSPAALTPESTSWLRDTNTKDEDYRLASASPSDARHPEYLKPVLVGAVFIAILLLVMMMYMIYICIKRKSLYSSVPLSDCNSSENTNVSDLVLCIPEDHNLPQKKLKESVE